jgi:hypothetical protein
VRPVRRPVVVSRIVPQRVPFGRHNPARPPVTRYRARWADQARRTNQRGGSHGRRPRSPDTVHPQGLRRDRPRSPGAIGRRPPFKSLPNQSPRQQRPATPSTRHRRLTSRLCRKHPLRDLGCGLDEGAPSPSIASSVCCPLIAQIERYGAARAAVAPSIGRLTGRSCVKRSRRSCVVRSRIGPRSGRRSHCEHPRIRISLACGPG